MTHSPQPDASRSARLIELAALFLRIGVTAFGGPAAHIAIMHDEVVQRRKWLTDQQFLDLLGATNLIPGPNSTEVAIHLGATRAGWLGLLVAGASFILPTTLIVLILAWAYVTFGSTPAAEWLLYGVKPVIIAVVAQAIWALGRKAIKNWLTGIVGLAVLAGFFLGVDSILLLFGGALIVMLLENARRLTRPDRAAMLLGSGSILAPLAAEVPFTLGLMFLTFLKIGAVLYGSGYTLLAFMQTDFVDRLGWLTTEQLIEAVAIGQVTPGPVSSTATFVGYILGSQSAGGAVMPAVLSALIATLGIFIPSFIFVAITHPLIPRMRASKWAGAFLDGTNAASLGLMAAVTIELARAAFVDPLTVVLGIAASIALIRFNVNSFWLVIGGALIGVLAALLG